MIKKNIIPAREPGFNLNSLVNMKNKNKKEWKKSSLGYYNQAENKTKWENK